MDELLEIKNPMFDGFISVDWGMLVLAINICIEISTVIIEFNIPFLQFTLHIDFRGKIKDSGFRFHYEKNTDTVSE